MTALRATIVGAHADLFEPLVVDDAPAPQDGPGRGGEPDSLRGHQVLVPPAPAGSDRTGEVARPGLIRREVVVDGWRFEVELEPERRAALREKARRDRADAGQSGPAEVRAIIPGVVVSVAVAVGDAVTAGQELLVVEAMKMQNELRSPRGGTVARVAVGERSTIEVGDVLVVIE